MKYTTTLQYRRRFNPSRDTYISAQWEDSHYPEYQVEGYEGLLLKDGRHQFTPVEFNYDLQVENNSLNITFSNTTEGRKLYYLTIDPSIFSDAEAYTLWYINDDILNRNLEVLKGEHFHPPSDPTIVTGQSHVVTKNQLVNAFSNTVVSKSPNLLGNNSIITFMVLKKNPTIDDILVILVRPRTTLDEDPDLITPEMQQNNIQHTGGDGWADHTTTFSGNVSSYSVNPINGITSILPTINVESSTTSGDIITVNFTTDPNVEFIYLEPSVGALPKVKIPVDAQGSGSFKVVTTGLDSGDEVRVKLGFKFWTSRAVFTKTI